MTVYNLNQLIGKINWNCPSDKISKHFTVHDALYLPSWERQADADIDVKMAVLNLCLKLDDVVDYLDADVRVHCCYRPVDYNRLVGGAPNSCHIARIDPVTGEMIAAMDFHPLDCSRPEDFDTTRDILNSSLEGWGLRLEDKHGACWLHMDTKNVSTSGQSRFFKP